MKAVILCGGFGKRMGKLSLNIPKPMTIVSGKNVLLRQVETLKREGITDFIFVTGYLGEKIKDFFGNGSDFGVSISYFEETEPLGTAGALFKLKLKEDFLLVNGDLIFDFDLKRMSDYHRKNDSLLTLFTHPNSHPYDSTLIETNKNGVVTAILEKNRENGFCSNLCNAGISIVSPRLLEMFSFEGEADFDRDVLKKAIKSQKVFSYKSPEYVFDMGTPERLKKAENDLENKLVFLKNLRNPQKAVFLDRDGTINKYKGFISDPKDFELIDKVAEAISSFRNSGYLVVVVTNQPVVARGECSEETLELIHKKMETLLGEDGAFLDEIYYCPHHTDKGFENEIKELKIDCDCRKPKPGMIFTAAEKFNIDLEKSFMVGDSLRDVETAVNAGCRAVFVGDKKKSPSDALFFESLYDFAVYLKNKTDV